jgi:predicted nucleic acid-binding protein
MTTERLSLDTNILVYAADRAAGERRARALEILDRVVRRGLRADLLLATAERHACEIVLSEDMQDGARFGRVTILDPFVGEVLPARIAELLR